MLDWAISGLGGLFGGLAGGVGSTVAGWAWDRVVEGIFSWLASGLALLIEWVWAVLDTGSTPRLTEGWFRNDLAGQIGVLAVAVTVAMMFASGIQAALAGRADQIIDAVKESTRALVASALTLTVIDVLVRLVDEASDTVWQVGRADLVVMLERLVAVTAASGPLATTFVGPLCLIVGLTGLLGLSVALMMRSSLIYVAAGLAPLVWSSSVLPLFRGTARRLVHLLVALIFSKLAIVVTLVVAVRLISNPSNDGDGTVEINDGAAAAGTLLSGFVCFLVAAITPIVLYKLMPTVEGAVAASGVAGGWGRSLVSLGQSVLIARGLSSSAATKPVSGQTASAKKGGGGGSNDASALPVARRRPVPGGSGGGGGQRVAAAAAVAAGPAGAAAAAKGTGSAADGAGLQASTRAQLLDAWEQWDQHPGRASTADRMVDVSQAAAGEVGMSVNEFRSGLAVGRRSGLSREQALDQVAGEL